MLGFIALTATLLGIGLGATKLRFRWPGLAVLTGLAVLVWLARAAAIFFGADATMAEDYVNGLGFFTAAAEFAIVMIWLLFSYGMGVLINMLARRLLKPTT